MGLWYSGMLLVSVVVLSLMWRLDFADEAQSKTHLIHSSNGTMPVQDQSKEPEEEIKHAFQDVDELAVWYALIALSVGLGGGWWIIRKTLKPIGTLTEAAERIHADSLCAQLPRAGSGDEVDRLTEVFNQMLVRLDISFQRIRDFTLHASHELKTPLTVMHSELEVLLSDSTVLPVHRERLFGHLEEVQRLTKIVDQLGLLTRADAGQIELARGAVPLMSLMVDTLADAKLLAEAQDILVQLNADEDVLVSADPQRLRQLLLILVDNAVKYNQPKGSLTLALLKDGDRAIIKVSNTGPGVPHELQPRVFERFFRGDPSHAKNIDGCGLGLSIAQWIATAHDGSIHFISHPNEMTHVIVRLPLLSR